MEEKKATPLSRKELEQENSLLIGQLHTLQVELERIEKRQGEAPSEDSEFESIRHANPSVTVTLAPDTKSEKSAFFARFSRYLLVIYYHIIHFIDCIFHTFK